MADTFRYRYGDTAPVVVAVLSVESCDIGDLVGLSTGNLYPAEDQALTHLSTAQYNFAANFAGVAAQRKSANAGKAAGGGPANRLRVSTAGVFEFDCPATALEVGDLVGAALDYTTSTLESQKVEEVSDLARAVGRVWRKKEQDAETKVLVKVLTSKKLGHDAT
ncbi:MAG: hypothetical protein IT429_17020 [Gemmataceae bacterium]|nr:hypothetical protein [Gemmataceae bacterium]